MSRLASGLVVAMLALSGCAHGPARPRFVNTSSGLEEREQPVTEEELRILERADQVLGDASLWDRRDDRACDPAASQCSLFCALQKASIEVLGKYEHRRVAMQEVRFAIEDVSGGRQFEHRLMDFNNLGQTTFADIKKVLSIARQRVAERLTTLPPRKDLRREWRSAAGLPVAADVTREVAWARPLDSVAVRQAEEACRQRRTKEGRDRYECLRTPVPRR